MQLLVIARNNLPRTPRLRNRSLVIARPAPWPTRVSTPCLSSGQAGSRLEARECNGEAIYSVKKKTQRYKTELYQQQLPVTPPCSI